MRIISWNANGIRALMKKDLRNWITESDPDILCLQETKIHRTQIEESELELEGYQSFWSCAEKKGYSGVALFTKENPIAVREMIMPELNDGEGRILEAEYPNFTLLNIYFPNGQSSEERLTYKLKFYDTLIPYLADFAVAGRNVIVCGDFNTAHHPIDLKNPEKNENYSGFMPIERKRLDDLIRAGYIDIYRHLYPDRVQYSWWTYRFKARERNVGWRIDYFFVVQGMVDQIADAKILDQVGGSDHCPIELILK